jgi:manganese transport protein
MLEGRRMTTASGCDPTYGRITRGDAASRLAPGVAGTDLLPIISDSVPFLLNLTKMARRFLPRHSFPEQLSTAVSGIATPFGRTGYLLVLLGTFACLAGAAVETMLSGAYNLCQFYNLPWGKNQKFRDVPTFSLSWLGVLVVAALLILVGFDPLKLVNISVVFGMVVMPLTYYPIMRAAMDKGIMGRHVNSRADTAVGILFLVLITLAALAAIPLMIATSSGQP